MKNTNLLIAIISCLLVSCSTQMKLVEVDYERTVVPEESGMNFVQLTNDEHHVVHPNITYSGGSIQWYAPTMISVSPDGDQIAFMGLRDNRFNIFIKSSMSGGAIVRRTFRNNVIDVSFSPDGEYLVFTDREGTSRQVKLIKAKSGAAVQQITNGSYADVGPRFSHDGRKIYFTRMTRRSGNNGTYYQSYIIWSYDLDSSLFAQHTEGFTPNVTPDGESLIFTRNNRDTKFGEIWKVDLESGQETLILSAPDRGFSSPQISPDGSRIAVVGSTDAKGGRPANLNIYTIRTDGTNLTQHTFHPVHDVSPVWSVDGQHLFILSQRGSVEGNYNIWRFSI